MRHDSRSAKQGSSASEQAQGGTLSVDGRASAQLRGHRYETSKTLQGDGSSAAAGSRSSSTTGRQDASEVAATALLQAHGERLATGALRVGVPPTSVAAVVLAEQAALGPREPDTLAMRFEPYVFWQQTGRWIVATHRDQSAERSAFQEASRIDDGAALQSLRMGIAQIAGSEAEAAGYPDATTMYQAHQGDEAAQLESLFGVIAADQPLQEAMMTEDWSAVAAHRAGPAWVALGYDDALAAGAAAWAEVTRGHGGDDDSEDPPKKPGRARRKP